ncbi:MULTISPECIES: helix-hairpin-helix domain-containing protein [unclassified Aureispira]|uniref:helix-hairpin-helix domain-containing protein n=1 Tax=unclassified Aureispira TaxID=2649989 RepID=UPI000697F786|nr:MULTISPECIES: helix-hairpin-helix domain-containing protein [unclassified Aureispira]WMX13882.1 helix-hairpin-helix domain-containing protein [Aureispira sp. CCB-E]
MSILIERASFEDRAKFFHKNRWLIARLLDDLAETAKKPKKKKADNKAKAKTKAKGKSKAKGKAKSKAPAKAKEAPPVEEKKTTIEEVVENNITEFALHDPTVEETSTPAQEPDDLTRVNGLGAKMMESLSAAGITSFEQLASLTKKHVAQLGESIRGFASAYERKDFKKQAKELGK